MDPSGSAGQCWFLWTPVDPRGSLCALYGVSTGAMWGPLGCPHMGTLRNAYGFLWGPLWPREVDLRACLQNESRTPTPLPSLPKTAPGSRRRHQDGPKQSQDGPKTAPRPAKRSKKRTQDSPRAPKTSPRQPKTVPRRSQDRPRGPQGGPKTAPRLPRRPKSSAVLGPSWGRLRAFLGRLRRSWEVLGLNPTTLSTHQLLKLPTPATS